MMHSVRSVAFFGSEAKNIGVECDIAAGLPHFSIVGLPDASVQESRERVRSALKNSGFTFPAKRVTVNLAPTNLRKSGSSFDLPIAIAILSWERNWKEDIIESSLFFGELGLDGSLKPTSGALPASILAKREWLKYIFLPKENWGEASFVKGILSVGVSNLSEIVAILESGWIPEMPDFCITSPESPQKPRVCLEEVRGQKWAKRALEIALAGGHHILLSGSPGSGKSLLAQACESLLPKMDEAAILETSSLYSIAGLLSEEQPIVSHRPFRTVYHTASPLSLSGGGNLGRPGEMALAHHGVLFLDELLEFDRRAIEILREPLESKEVRFSRVSGTYKYPADFSLIATTNPCPCGFLWDSEKECRCSPAEIERYSHKLSWPIVDRIDLFVAVPRLKTLDFTESWTASESSETIRARIEKVRSVSHSRLGNQRTNASMTNPEIQKFANLGEDAKTLLHKAIEELGLSGRAYFRSIKVARTIADLEGSENIGVAHIAEALGYRKREK